MYLFMLSLVTFMVSFQGASSASVQLPVGLDENIKNNLVGYESDSVEYMTPPTAEAKNYFSSPSDKYLLNSESPYVVEIHKNYLSIKTAELPPQTIKLNETESEDIQKLSLSFVQLLNTSKLSSHQPENEKETTDWKDLNPVITLSNSGVFLQFLRISKEEPNATEVSSATRQILWDFLTKYTRSIFEEKLNQLKLNEKYAEVFDSPVNLTNSSPFQNFVNFLWSIMKLSVHYAETAFNDWTTSQPDATAPEVEMKVRSTTVTVFTYEEPSSFHEFPSQEFLYRRKDKDSIFYGRGVI